MIICDVNVIVNNGRNVCVLFSFVTLLNADQKSVWPVWGLDNLLLNLSYKGVRGRNLRPWPIFVSFTTATIREESNSSSTRASASFKCCPSERNYPRANFLRVNDKTSSHWASVRRFKIVCTRRRLLAMSPIDTFSLFCLDLRIVDTFF